MSERLLPEEPPLPPPPQKPLARLILASFVLTFMLSRVLVILIMARKVPDFFLHLGGTHVHHLNYGIFLLSGVGAFLLLRRPTGRPLSAAAMIYGVGLALTFDEFGMWLHLGGSYWQRASFDAIVTIAGLFSLFAVTPTIRKFNRRQWVVTVIVCCVSLLFALALLKSLERFTGGRVSNYLHRLEQSGPG